ncbi:hypothetical protein C8R44DRAFT_767514 [Mycena epipterygia]|nr:hypothetical protein C8R44DRAFT_767514 [Mycena epipterygia]
MLFFVARDSVCSFASRNIPSTLLMILCWISSCNSGCALICLDKQVDCRICMSTYRRISSSVARISIICKSARKQLRGREVIMRLTVGPSITIYLSNILH